MKIVIINGSARKGNTLAAINAFIKGASEKNKIEIIEPDKLNIAPCKGECIIADYYEIYVKEERRTLILQSVFFGILPFLELGILVTPRS